MPNHRTAKTPSADKTILMFCNRLTFLIFLSSCAWHVSFSSRSAIKDQIYLILGRRMTLGPRFGDAGLYILAWSCFDCAHNELVYSKVFERRSKVKTRLTFWRFEALLSCGKYLLVRLPNIERAPSERHALRVSLLTLPWMLPFWDSCDHPWFATINIASNTLLPTKSTSVLRGEAEIAEFSAVDLPLKKDQSQSLRHEIDKRCSDIRLCSLNVVKCNAVLTQCHLDVSLSFVYLNPFSPSLWNMRPSPPHTS